MVDINTVVDVKAINVLMAKKQEVQDEEMRMAAIFEKVSTKSLTKVQKAIKGRMKDLLSVQLDVSMRYATTTVKLSHLHYSRTVSFWYSINDGEVDITFSSESISYGNRQIDYEFAILLGVLAQAFKTKNKLYHILLDSSVAFNEAQINHENAEGRANRAKESYDWGVYHALKTHLAALFEVGDVYQIGDKTIKILKVMKLTMDVEITHSRYYRTYTSTKRLPKAEVADDIIENATPRARKMADVLLDANIFRANIQEQTT